MDSHTKVSVSHGPESPLSPHYTPSLANKIGDFVSRSVQKLKNFFTGKKTIESHIHSHLVQLSTKPSTSKDLKDRKIENQTSYQTIEIDKKKGTADFLKTNEDVEKFCQSIENINLAIGKAFEEQKNLSLDDTILVLDRLLENVKNLNEHLQLNPKVDLEPIKNQIQSLEKDIASFKGLKESVIHLEKVEGRLKTIDGEIEAAQNDPKRLEDLKRQKAAILELKEEVGDIRDRVTNLKNNECIKLINEDKKALTFEIKDPNGTLALLIRMPLIPPPPSRPESQEIIPPPPPSRPESVAPPPPEEK